MKSVYVIGALKNWKVVQFGNYLRKNGFDVFDNWISPGPLADSYLRKYTRLKGLSYKETLNDYAAEHVFEFDKKHLDRCDIAVLVMPAGKSCCLELGYMRGCGKPGFILFDREPKRVDVMFRFATDIFFDKKLLLKALKAI
jgi:hypothetical protein